MDIISTAMNNATRFERNCRLVLLQNDDFARVAGETSAERIPLLKAAASMGSSSDGDTSYVKGR